MKTILALCFCVAAVSAGVIPWSREAEQEARELYRRYCSGRTNAGEDRNTAWFCKKSLDGNRLVVQTHRHDLGPIVSDDKEHLVFIETPAEDYKHDILVTGQINANQKTKIIVHPGKDTHNYDVKTEIKTDIQSSKPAILYLRNSPNEPEGTYGSGFGYATGEGPAPAIISTRPVVLQGNRPRPRL